MNSTDVPLLACLYVYHMSKSKSYNPQNIANISLFKKNNIQDIRDEISIESISFFKNFSPYKARDFVYKSDYFTPRNMYLINPWYYLYYTRIVFEIITLLVDRNIIILNNSAVDFSKENMRIFYSGILDLDIKNQKVTKNATFNRSYQLFQSERKKQKGYSVLKVDLQDFFNSIDVNLLINKLKKYIGNHRSIEELENLFKVCGFNSLPQLHYSIASSILSQVYLLDVDIKLNHILREHNLELIRYVDDMFIIDKNNSLDEKKINEILNKLSSILWEDMLVLNSNKTKYFNPDEYESFVETVSNEYGYKKNYLSDKIVDSKANEILDNGSFLKAIIKLCKLEESNGIDLNKYKEIMNQYFSIEGEDINKVINNIIYSNKWKTLNYSDLYALIVNWKYILFNPSQFTVLYIMVHRHMELIQKNKLYYIKEILNYLFSSKYFTLRDTIIAVTYLLQNKNKNIDLLNRIERINPEYIIYINKFL